jgi:hypothetical protein
MHRKLEGPKEWSVHGGKESLYPAENGNPAVHSMKYISAL